MNTQEFVEKEGSTKVLYTGIARLSPIVVNPTSDGIRKLFKMGEDKEVREPNYDFDGGTRIDIYCKNESANSGDENSIVKLVYFVGDEEMHNQSNTKSKYTNNNNQSMYYPDINAIKEANAASPEEWKQFRLEGVRIAKKGEVELMDFIISLYNINQFKTKCVFDNWSKIASGNVKELQELITNAAGRAVYVLLGVKDGKYQDSYTGNILRDGYNSKSEEKLYKDASREIGGFKSEWHPGECVEYSSEPAPSQTEVFAEEPKKLF